jgi:two-component system phosphate regulon response regulator PhoB
MPQQRILVVDDEPDILGLVTYQLSRQGFRVSTAVNGRTAIETAEAEVPDLIILDLMLPELDGYEALRLLRDNPKTSRIPIILLTARDEDDRKIQGFELGADDYVTKPFNAQELVLRVEAVLRRVRAEPVASRRLLKVGPIELDKDAMTASLGGQPVDLTLLEYRLLETLLERRGRVQSRQQLLEAVWDTNARIGTRTVDMHVARLRSKLEEAGDMIETVRGVGYRIRAEANG